MEEAQQHIGKVETAFIGFEDHGLLSVSLTFNYGGTAQGIGHRAFGSSSEEPDEFAKWRVGHEMGMDFIRRLLLAFGVNEWDRLVGRTAFVTATWMNIERIDPLPTEKGKPFDIAEWAESYNALVT